MGYGYYEIPTPMSRRDIPRGYGVSDKCNQRGCRERINRGLAYLCYECTWYFCEKHLGYSEREVECFAGVSGQVCKKCRDILERRNRRENRESNFGMALEPEPEA